jgi:chemotaxis protein CheZ
MSKKIFTAEIKKFSLRPEPVSSVNERYFMEIMSEIKSLQDRLDVGEGFENSAQDDDDTMDIVAFVNLRQELQQLSEVIIETRREIASLHSSASGPKLNAISDQLDAVVTDTETATNTILEAVETIEVKNESLHLNATSPEETENIEAIDRAVMTIYEACNFQDITGQRISKVVETFAFVEQRVSAMINILGGQSELENIDIVEQRIQRDEDVELKGPETKGHEISQEEIDSLFD